MASARITLHPRQHKMSSISLVETHWGYILRPRGNADAYESATRYLGAVLVAASLGVWLVPAGLIGVEALATKIMLAAVLAVVGGVLYLAALRGFGSEAQIDTNGREVRLARRNRRGASKVVSRVPFDLIKSVYVQRDAHHPATLCLRNDAGDVVAMVAGLEREMNLVHARLCKDLRSPEERMEMRLAVSNPTPRPLVRIKSVRSA